MPTAAAAPAPAPAHSPHAGSAVGSVSAANSAARTAAAAAAVSQQSDNVAHALAGAGGGLLSMALTYPLITLSTRAQVESKSAKDTTGKRPTTLEAARRIVDREGLSGLYSGLESALFGISVTNFVYYYWYEWSRSAFAKRATKTRGSSQLSTVESMAAGAVAGCATVFMTNPIWVVNTRMTTNRQASGTAEKSKSTWATFVDLVKNEGFSRLFAGVIPALVLVSNPILQYTIFEQMKNALLARRRAAAGAGAGAAISPIDAFVLGAIGKLLATTITYPYITVKSRMHVANNKPHPSGGGAKDVKGKGPALSSSSPSSASNSAAAVASAAAAAARSGGAIASLKHIIKTDGYAGLYAGIGPKLTQSVLTAAFLFAFKDVLYAVAKRLLVVRQKKLLRA